MGKIVSLEALRGLAALIVVADHLVYTFRPEWKSGIDATCLSVFHNGHYAVRTFFVLSGVVLSIGFFRNRDLASLGSAAARRYFRLAIPVSAAVSVAFVLHVSGMYYNAEAADLLGSQGEWIRGFYAFPPDGGIALRDAAVSSYLPYPEAFPFRRTYDVVLWTMRVEFRGSFIVFAFLAFFGRLRNRWVFYLTCVALCGAFRQFYIIDFLVGVALADLASRRPVTVSNASWAGAVLIGLICGDARVFQWLLTLGLPSPGGLYELIQSAGAGLLVSAALGAGGIRRAMELRPVAWLGTVSFPLYLIHIPMICSVGCGTFVLLRGYSGIEAASLVASLASVLASLAFAAILANTVEQWAVAWPRQIFRRFFATPL
jgi:peptidoglycan/LPS O-acetylase OafA/YrhL